MSVIKDSITKHDDEEKADLYLIHLTTEIAKEVVDNKLGSSSLIKEQIKLLESFWESNFLSFNKEILDARLRKEKQQLFESLPTAPVEGDSLNTQGHTDLFPFFNTFPRQVQEEYCSLRKAMKLNTRGVFEPQKPSAERVRSTTATFPTNLQPICTKEKHSKNLPSPVYTSVEPEIQPFLQPKNVEFIVWFYPNVAVRRLRPFKEKTDRKLDGKKIMKLMMHFLQDQLNQSKTNSSNKFCFLELSGEGYFHASGIRSTSIRDSSCHNVALRFRSMR